MQEVKKFIMIGIVAILAIVGIWCIGNLAENVDNAKIVVCQSPVRGEMKYWITPGVHYQGFGHLTYYNKTEQFWFGGEDMEGKAHGKPIKVRFRDGSEGFIYGSFRIILPLDDYPLSMIQSTYSGRERLMNELVATAANNAVYTTGSLMTAFESYAERKNELRSYIEDQLTNGIYMTATERIEVIDPITGETKFTNVASLVRGENGEIVRDGSAPFAKYGIVADQLSITDIKYSDAVLGQIAKQQAATMDIQTAKAEAAKAQQEAIKVEEEGKAQAAKAKWEQEKIKAVEVTKAEQEREVSRLAAERAEFDKKKIIAEGQAEAEANRLKVAAGLTPQERAEWEYKTKVGVAEALSGIKLPTYVVAGGSGGSSNAMDAMGLKMMTDLVDKMSN